MESLRRQLLCTIKSHLGAKSHCARAVIQNVDRPSRYQHIAFGINVVREPPNTFGHVLDVYVIIEYEYHFGEHHLTQPPHGTHNLKRMAGIPLFDADKCEI